MIKIDTPSSPVLKVGSAIRTGLAIIGGGGGPVLPTNSLSFNGTNQSLSMGNSDWGAYDRTQCTWVFGVNTDSSGNQTIYARGDANTELAIQYQSGGTMNIILRDSGGTESFGRFSVGWTTGTWAEYKIDYDGSQATNADRVKVYKGDVLQSYAITPTWPSAIRTTTSSTYWGADSGGNFFDGEIFQPTFVSGATPANADVFDESGKLKDTSGLTGLWSRISANSDAVTDDVRVPWTNNNGVTTTASAP